MYKKMLNVFLAILTIAVVVAGIFLAYTYYDTSKKKSDAEKFIDEEFDKIIINISEQEEKQPEPSNNENQNNNNNNNYYGIGNTDGVPLSYKGFPVAGKLEIPKTSIRYPVLQETTSAKAIELSLVKIYGPELNTPGNVVIAGHNNNNRLFFGRNKDLQIGDKIYITDMKGKKLEYTIYKKYYTPGDDYAYISRETNGEIEVTLYTCDATGKNRLVICARVEK